MSDYACVREVFLRSCEQQYDAAIIVSQDGDLVPAVELVREVVRDQGITVELESGLPAGINTWSEGPADKAFFCQC